MNAKIVIFPLLAAALIAIAPLEGQAKPPHEGRRGPEAHQPQITPEQRAKVDAIFLEHQKDTAPLRDALMQKRLEARLLKSNPNVTPDDLRKLAAEITDLHRQLREKGEALQAKLREAGLPGKHMRGPRHDMPAPMDGPMRGEGAGCPCF